MFTRSLTALAAVTLLLPAAAAQAATVTAGAAREVPFALPHVTPAAANEIPPDIVATPGRAHAAAFYVSSEGTWRCATDDTYASATVGCDGAGQSSFQLAADYLKAPTLLPTGREHRRSYYGVFSAVEVRDAAGNLHVVTADHGENKNVMQDGTALQNTVYLGADALVPPVGDCVSGTDATGLYRDCAAAYSAFVGTSTEAVDASTGQGAAELQDLGPAVWPKYGYASADRQTRLGYGLRHPQIIDGGDGFLYLFYYDSGDRQQTDFGFRVARSPVTSLGRGWQTWVESTGTWVDSLPEGVSAASSAAALSRRSPAQSDPLFASTTSTFNVAKVAGYRGWVGVEQPPDTATDCQTSDGSTDHPIRTYLRTSTDLVHWSARIPVDGAGLNACGFRDFPTAYARLLRADGLSTKEIDPATFSIVGTRYGAKVNRVDVQASGLTAGMTREPTAAVASTAKAGDGPALLRVQRARVTDGRLDLLGRIAPEATGAVRVRYIAGGRTASFSLPIPANGRLKVRRRLPAAMRDVAGAVVKIDYPGGASVHADAASLRAAPGRAALQRRTARIRHGRLHASGTISRKARGVVRVRLGYRTAAGRVTFLAYRVRVRDGRWSVNAPVADAAAHSGEIVVTYSGSVGARIGGVQLAGFLTS